MKPLTYLDFILRSEFKENVILKKLKEKPKESEDIGVDDDKPYMPLDDE